MITTHEQIIQALKAGKKIECRHISPLGKWFASSVNDEDAEVTKDGKTEADFKNLEYRIRPDSSHN